MGSLSLRHMHNNMKKRTVTIILILILALGTGLRLWQLGSIPSSPDWDEVALGYDAYSILHTGRDEFGIFLPAVLRSFEDYKPAFYAYLAIPSVAVFGLTTFAVRFPSAIMGIAAIIGMYFLIEELFNREITKNAERRQGIVIGLLGAFLLAISPWHLQFSRVAFETNVGLTFNILVILFFLKGLKRPWVLLLAAFFAGLNLSVYQSERVFTPFLIVAMIIIYRKELFTLSKKYLAASIIVSVIVILPTVFFIVQNPTALQRVKETSIISQQPKVLIAKTLRLKDDIENHDLVGQVIDNRRVVYIKSIMSGYLAHFDPNWLFIKGDGNRHHAPRMGLLFLFSLPFLLLGIYQLVFGKFEKKAKYVVFSWLLLSPIPASITFEVPHAVRTMNMLPMLLVLTAVGLFVGYRYVCKNRVLKIISLSIVLFLVSFNFVYFIDQYFVQQNYFHAYDWQYGYAQAIPQIEQLKRKYKKIVISDTIPMDKSYMFFLFYLQYPPQQYQQIVAANPNSPTNVHHFELYEFKPIRRVDVKQQNGVLYVGTKNDFDDHIVARKTIPYPDGTPAILFVDPKDNL